MAIEISFVSIISIISFGISAITGIFIARTLSTSDYGVMVYFSSIYIFGTLLIGFGLNTQTINEIAGRLDKKDELKGRFTSLLVLRLMTLVPLIILGFALTLIIHNKLYLYVSIAASITVLADFFLSVLRGLQRIYGVTFALLFQSVIYLLILSAGAVYSVNTIFGAIVMSFTLVSIFAVSIIAQSRSLTLYRKFHFSYLDVKDFIRPSALIYGIALFQVGYSVYATLLLGASANFNEAAQLSPPLTLVRLLPLALSPLLSTIFYPRICLLYAKKDNDSLIRLVSLFYKLFAALTICMMVLFFCYPDVIINILYTEKFYTSIPYLAILAPLGFILAIENIFTLSLIGVKASRKALLTLGIRFGLLVLAISVILAFGFSNQLLLFTSAYLLTGLIGLIIEYWQVQDETHLKLPIFRTLIVGICAVIIGFGLRADLPNLSQPIFSNIYKTILTGSVVIVLITSGLFLDEIRILFAKLVVFRKNG